MRSLTAVFALAIFLMNSQAVLLAQQVAKSRNFEQSNLTSFDPSNIELQWLDNRWQLLADGNPLKDFGRRESDGRLALRIIRDLKLTQHGTLGTPQPIIEYWLADGRAPVGPCLGLRTSPIDLEHIRVEEVQKQWCVRDTYRILFNFGSQEGEAKKALALIKHYHFNQIGYVGQGTPVMLVLLADSNSMQAAEVDTLKSSRVAHHERMTGPLSSKSTNAIKVIDPNGAPEGHQSVSPQSLTRTDKALENKLPDLGHADMVATMPHARQLAEPSATSDAEIAVERVPFDWRQVQATKVNQNWQVVVGKHVLAQFGKDEHGAFQAANLLQSYHCTEQCKMGPPNPTFVYYLSNGLAPHGTLLGVTAVPFHASDLVTKQIGSEWFLWDKFRVVAAFGNKPDDAAQALKIVQRYKFDRVVTVGTGATPGLVVFARGN